MRVVIVGLGIQGKKRMAIAQDEVIATVDPYVPSAEYQTIQEVPLEKYDAVLVCTPDQAKLEILSYLLSHGKDLLVEKPLLTDNISELETLARLASANKAVCYTAYNHRFEPHIMTVKQLLDQKTIGSIYLAKLFYGNGTARDVRNSPWRDQGLGVLPDLGSHLLDMCLYLLGDISDHKFKAWSYNRFENKAFDHVIFGSNGQPVIELEMTLLSWRNTFTLDLWGELGSIHINCLCKWGPSILTVRNRVFPSGRPTEQVTTIESSDPTWLSEYQYFKQLCQTKGTNIKNDIWISSIINDLGRSIL